MRPLTQALLESGSFAERETLEVPPAHLLALPEKVVQFGTGGFLRGFADFFIDRANRQGLFEGRVVAVGSTGSGRTRLLNQQDGLYTLIEQGLLDGDRVDAASVVSAISRAISAQEQWDAVLACARNPEIEAIISNTTEVGIVLDEADRPDLSPPRSFPGKLTAFLYARAQAFDFDPAYAPVILPCELLERNGDRLRGIVETLAERWYGETAFAEWLAACRFCNTLVDRIVPGMPDAPQRDALFQRLGYRDDLLITAEPYRLWAIEGDDVLLERLPFLRADEGIIVTSDITPYRELKVRILNGTHTLMVPAAIQYGLHTVAEAVADPVFGRFVRHVMLEGIVPTLSLEREQAAQFAESVLDRFANPFIEHRLRDIMLQATMKMRVRVVPSLRWYQTRESPAMMALALAFALFLLLRRDDDPADYPPDDQAETIRNIWRAVADATKRLNETATLAIFIQTVLSDESLWHTDLTTIPGVAAWVHVFLALVLQDGPQAVIQTIVAQWEESSP